MQQAMRRALDDLESRVGDIDTFVANELGYELYEVIGSSNRDGYFSAEQVDALAMAIDNVAQGKGFIIGDQTGVGKGRFVAAMLRYAHRKGMVPVFLTKDPGLYADMVRDMRDIGMEDAHKRVLATNRNLRGKHALPLSSDPNDVMLAPSKAKMDRALGTMQSTGRLPDGYDMLFTTYSQLQQYQGKDTDRMHSMRSIAPNAMFVLDESHEAGGGKPAERAQENKDGTVKVPRSEFVRELLGPSQGAVFSSATYAKNPSVMSLYFKTDLSLMTDKLDELPTVIEAGGVPLQQVIANMLVESGQYARRERTFEGVEMNLEQLVTDKAVATRGAEVLRHLFELDVQVMQDVREQFIAEAGKEGFGGVVDTATGKAGMTSINFASVMHNVAAQYLLAIKVDAVVEEAVALHRAGKKPIIALSNTNASIIAEHAEKMGVQSGQGLDVPFNVILERYLDRLRRITVKDEDENTSHIYLTDQQISAFGPPDALEAFNEARRFIQSAQLDGLPGAPIDAILDRLEAAGINAGEITGRTVTLRGNVLERRDSSPAAKKRTMAEFNIGDLDALVINRSGSTGYSMHATDRPGNDGKPRHMIILQPEPNIDLFMQMLGRIHRTGQTQLPGYTIAVSDLAVEKRPAAVLMKKMASLNANTTASKQSAVSLDNVTDFLNAYGDKVVAEFLKENRELGIMLDMQPSKDIGGLAAKFTGRLMSMKPDDVSRIYEQIEASYADYIDALDRMGMNALEAKVLELDARTVSKVEVVPAKESDSPFGAPAYVETVDVKRLGKPYSPEQLEAEIQKVTNGAEPRTVAAGLIEKLRAKLPNALEDIKARKAAAERRLAEAKTDKQKDAAQDSINRAESAGVAIRDRLSSIERMIDGLAPGRVGTIRVRVGDGEHAASQDFAAASLGVDISRVKENPTVASAMTVRLAIADAGREIRVPLSKFLDAESDYTWWEVPQAQRGSILTAFEEGQTESRETRQVVTGNIPSGFSQFKKGQIILYTDADGALHQGVMLPKNLDAGKALANRPVRLSPAQVVEFLQEGNHGSRVVTSEDGILRVSYNDGEFAVLIKTAGARKYIHNKQVHELVGIWEQRRGAKVYRKRMGAEDIEKVLTIYTENLGTELSTTIDRDVARKITGEEVPDIASAEEVESGQQRFARTRSRDAEGRFARFRRQTPDDDIPVGGVRYETSPEAQAKATKLAAALRRELDKTGLREIPVETAERLFGKMPDGSMVPIDGAFVDGVMSVALERSEGRDATFIVRHETIHALRDPGLWGREGGLFRPAEWRALEAAARADKARMAEIRELYAGYSEELHLEEAIADMYADWAEGRLEAKGFLRAAFQRIKAVLQAIRSALRGQGFTTPHQVFRRVAEGEIGARQGGNRRSRAPAPGTQAFANWFGNSKVVDQDGAPLVVYHGTNSDIAAFDPMRRGEQTGAGSARMGFFFSGHPGVAASYTEAASEYEAVPLARLLNRLTRGAYERLNEAVIRPFGLTAQSPGSNVMPVYLSIQNPLVVDQAGSKHRDQTYGAIIRFARAQGHDGVIIRNTFDPGYETGADPFAGDYQTDVFVAFRPNQIKSTHNVGTFDPSDPRVSFSTQAAPIFHSPLLRAVQGAKQTKAPAGDWKAILAKLPGVKKIEIEWLGINEWLDAQEGQVTRQQLEEFIAANQVRVTEDVLGGEEPQSYGGSYGIEVGDPIEPDWEVEAESYLDEARRQLTDEVAADEDVDFTEAEVQDRAEDIARERFDPTEFRARLYDVTDYGREYEGSYNRLDDDYFFAELGYGLDERAAIATAEERASADWEAEQTALQESDGFTDVAYHEHYTEAGGENYREILLRVPNLHQTGANRPPTEAEALRAIDAEEARLGRPLRPDERNRIRVKYPFIQTGHFPQPNIVVHARVKDRRDASNGRVLFVEEIQSDLASRWREAQEGPEVTARRRELEEERNRAYNRHDKAKRELVARLAEASRKDRVAYGARLGGGIYDEALLTVEKDEPRLLRDLPESSVVKQIVSNERSAAEYAANTDVKFTRQDAVATLIARDKEMLDLARQMIESFGEANRLQDELLALGTEKTIDPGTPDTPFKEELAYQLMVKRLLREAAEKGYDKLAWTPGYMQAERWGEHARSVVAGVRWESRARGQDGTGNVIDGADRTVFVEMSAGNEFEVPVSETGTMLTVLQSGNPNGAFTQYHGRPLKDLIGPDLAKQVLSEPSGSVSNQHITFPDSGYAIAYDQQIRKAVDKFVRKFGSRVEKTDGIEGFDPSRTQYTYAARELTPHQFMRKATNLNQATGGIYEGFISQNDGVLEDFQSHVKDNRKIYDLVRDAPLDLLRGIFPDVEGRPVWSVEITPEMRASAKLSQPMFAVTRPTRRQQTTNRVVSRMVEEQTRHGVTHRTPMETRRQSFLNAIGTQPIDAAFRIPFMVFGGLDQAGRWRYGKAGEKRIRDLVVNKRMGFLTPLVERIRTGMIDRYGLPEDYVERDRRRGVDEAKIAAEGREHLEALKAADIGAEESRVLQAVLTGEEVADADMAKLSEPIRNAIDQMGAEAVELGLISAEAYERNRGKYLHRVYQKHELDSGAFGRWVQERFATRRRKIVGNQFKGRGIFEQVEPERILRDNAEFLGARRGKPQKGDKFVILDLRSTSGTDTLPGIEGESKGRLKKRVYWPADRAIPARLDNYENRGTFEVRGTKGGKLVLWRDFTQEERLKMGEILDARYTIAKTYSLMSQDLATGRFFADIAKNEEWSRDTPPPEAQVDEDPEERSWLKRMWVDPSMEWVKVPAVKIGKSDTHRYGALAGRYVRADIWRDMQELRALQTPTFWSRILTQWKLNKTARSPVVHMNNVMSNFMLMDMADVRLPDLIAGIRSMAKGDASYQEALEAGAFGADMVTQEFRQNVLEPLLKDLRDDMRQGRGGAEAEIGRLGTVLDKLWRFAKAADQKMVNAYQMEDQIFRMGTYIRRRNQGFTVDEAAVEARDQFLNYDIRAPWINAARRSVLPFISYTYRAVPKVAQTVAERPWKIAKYLAIYEAINALSYTLAPSDWDEEEERKSLRDHEQGLTWVGTERMVRMPWLSDGNPVFLDVRRWVPAGDVFDTGGSDLPAWLHIGGPLVMGMELYLNRSAFLQDDIVNPLTDTAGERMVKRADFIYKNWMPSAPWVPNSWYQEKLARAIRGDALKWGSNEPYGLGEAALSSVGIKIKPKNVEVGYLGWQLEFDRIQRELKAQASSLNRQRGRNLISDEVYNRAMDDLMEKLERLRRNAEETFPD